MSEKRFIKNVTIEGARIGKRNFAGREEQYNAAGHRYFLLYLNNDLAKMMEDDGWNIKYLKPRDEEEEARPFISVSVAFGKVPPKIVLVSNGIQTQLTADNISILDNAELENVDLVIRPYIWEMGTKSGVKAYVKTLYATLSAGDFAGKYGQMSMPLESSAPDLGIESDSLPF